jgi:uncharacterized protein YvpB
MLRMHAQRTIAIVLLGVILITATPVTAKAEPFPERAYINGVVGHAQGFSLSCEARSAVDWAAFWDVDIRERKFLAKLPRSDNPDAGFVGKPTDAWGNTPPYSYGVHAGPVAALLREYGLQAEAQRGMKWDELRAEIAAGRPVIVWVIGQVWRGIPQRFTTSSGHKITVARYEHTMILTGYSPEEVQLVDAYSGQTQTYRLRNFLASWDTLGNMAVTGQAIPKEAQDEFYVPQAYLPVVIGRSSEAASPNPPPDPSKIYTVQRGDFVVGIARRFNISWRKLADINNINHPYTLFPGQKLKIP